MGVDITVLDFLMKFKGRIGGSTLQLGKQGLHISGGPGDDERRAAEEVMHRYDPASTFDSIYSESGFAENLFKYLGSTSLAAMDASSYEGAEIIHDLNTPAPDALRSRFDVIFDGGTLEHVFNIPMAFANVKSMLRQGGLFLSVNAANNQLGHGFYQFSPELMWRVFSAEEGYRVDLLQIVVSSWRPEPVDIPDPAQAGRRLEIGMTDGPAYILVAATKTGDGDAGRVPQQSDYSRIWSSLGDNSGGEPARDFHAKQR